MMTWALVFTAMAVLDFVWAEYTAAISAGKRLASSTWAVAIILCSGYVTKSYVDNPVLLIPAGAGAFLGTWLAVHLHRGR